MPGLSLMAGGNARVRGSASVGPATSTAQPSSVTEAAFGSHASSSPARSASLFMPNDAFGVTLWVGVAGLAALLLVRHSLPR